MVRVPSIGRERVHVSATAGGSRRLPVLAIVGRPNVGKSTLFNRLVKAKKAIVDNLPGVTRDRNYGAAEWCGGKFLLIDTGGFESDPGTALERQIQEQSRLAVEEADVILYLLDGKASLNPVDCDAVNLLRRVNKPVFFAVNKIDTKRKEDALFEFYSLGLSECFPLSAEHGLGLGGLMDRIVEAFPEASVESGVKRGLALGLAIVGRPNVGKSTLVNRLLGYERSLVDSQPGTTRDALDSPFMWGEDQYTLVDTAGIRRKARITDRIERYSVVRAFRSVDRGNLIVHLLDTTEGVTGQDAQILAYALQRGKGLVLAVNKWDLIPREERNTREISKKVQKKLPFLDFAPVVFISAQTGQGVRRLMSQVKQISHTQSQWIRTSVLNQALRAIVGRHPPPHFQGREVKLYYATQTAVSPVTFTLFVNLPKGVVASYERYLVNHFRLSLGLENVPIRLVLRARREGTGRRKK